MGLWAREPGSPHSTDATSEPAAQENAPPGASFNLLARDPELKSFVHRAAASCATRRHCDSSPTPILQGAARPLEPRLKAFRLWKEPVDKTKDACGMRFI